MDTDYGHVYASKMFTQVKCREDDYLGNIAGLRKLTDTAFSFSVSIVSKANMAYI